MSRKIIITLSGPSNAGKTVLEDALIKAKVATRVLGFTTRPPRNGETDGVDNHFISREAALALMATDECFHQIEHSGEYYGKTETYFNDAFAQNPVVVAVATPEGARQIRQYYQADESVTVVSFFVTASTDTLVARMLKRFENQDKPDHMHYAKRIRKLLSDEVHWGSKYKLTFNETLVSSDTEALQNNVQHIYQLIQRLNSAYIK